MPRASKGNSSPNSSQDNTNMDNVFNSDGTLNWSELEKEAEKAAAEAREKQFQKIGETAMAAKKAAAEGYIQARGELAGLGVHYERVKKEKTGDLRKGTVYRMVTEKYGNALDKQRTYNERLNQLQGTADKPEWVSGDSMVTIANLIPKIEGQTGQEYAEYITEIRNQIPKAKGEDDTAYRRRIQDAFNKGDLQFFATQALIDPQSATDVAIGERLSRITKLQRQLDEAPNNMSQEQQDYIRNWLKTAKIELYGIAVKAEKEDCVSRRSKPEKRKMPLWTRIARSIPQLFKNNERRNRNELRISKEEGMAVISQLIPKIEGQTAEDYRNLITRIYSRYPKAIGETDVEYEREIDEVVYLFAARILVNPLSSDDDASFFKDVVEDEIREKFKQIENKFKNPDGTKVAELASQMRQAKMDTFKKLVEKRIKTLEGH